LYSETGWTTLSSGRHNRKLQLFYNIKNGHAPNYLGDLIPPTVQSTTIYPVFVKIGYPVTILAASRCNFSSLVE
jgi:hypothetical protein